MELVRVGVRTGDPLSRVGLISLLRACPRIVVVGPDKPAGENVLFVQAERMTPQLVSELRAERWAAVPKVLLVDELRDDDVLGAVECGVVVVIPRAHASGKAVVEAVLTASSGRGSLPPDLLGRLLDSIRRVQHEVLGPRGLGSAGLTPREIDVLRLVAEGLGTGEIADRLCYSERTVKNVIQKLTIRLNLRNRPHAVAYAVQAGVI